MPGMMGVVDALELIVDEGRPANAGRFFQLGHDLLVLLDELSDVPVAWQITSLRTADRRQFALVQCAADGGVG